MFKTLEGRMMKLAKLIVLSFLIAIIPTMGVFASGNIQTLDVQWSDVSDYALVGEANVNGVQSRVSLTRTLYGVQLEIVPVNYTPVEVPLVGGEGTYLKVPMGSEYSALLGTTVEIDGADFDLRKGFIPGRTLPYHSIEVLAASVSYEHTDPIFIAQGQLTRAEVMEIQDMLDQGRYDEAREYAERLRESRRNTDATGDTESVTTPGPNEDEVEVPAPTVPEETAVEVLDVTVTWRTNSKRKFFKGDVTRINRGEQNTELRLHRSNNRPVLVYASHRNSLKAWGTGLEGAVLTINGQQTQSFSRRGSNNKIWYEATLTASEFASIEVPPSPSANNQQQVLDVIVTWNSNNNKFFKGEITRTNRGEQNTELRLHRSNNRPVLVYASHRNSLKAWGTGLEGAVLTINGQQTQSFSRRGSNNKIWYEATLTASAFASMRVPPPTSTSVDNQEEETAPQEEQEEQTEQETPPQNQGPADYDAVKHILLRDWINSHDYDYSKLLSFLDRNNVNIFEVVNPYMEVLSQTPAYEGAHYSESYSPTSRVISVDDRSYLEEFKRIKGPVVYKRAIDLVFTEISSGVYGAMFDSETHNNVILYWGVHYYHGTQYIYRVPQLNVDLGLGESATVTYDMFNWEPPVEVHLGEGEVNATVKVFGTRKVNDPSLATLTINGVAIEGLQEVPGTISDVPGSSVRHGEFTTEVSSDVALAILNLAPSEDGEETTPSNQEEENSQTEQEEQTQQEAPQEQGSEEYDATKHIMLREWAKGYNYSFASLLGFLDRNNVRIFEIVNPNIEREIEQYGSYSPTVRVISIEDQHHLERYRQLQQPEEETTPQEQVSQEQQEQAQQEQSEQETPPQNQGPADYDAVKHILLRDWINSHDYDYSKLLSFLNRNNVNIFEVINPYMEVLRQTPAYEGAHYSESYSPTSRVISVDDRSYLEEFKEMKGPVVYKRDIDLVFTEISSGVYGALVDNNTILYWGVYYNHGTQYIYRVPQLAVDLGLGESATVTYEMFNWKPPVEVFLGEGEDNAIVKVFGTRKVNDPNLATLTINGVAIEGLQEVPGTISDVPGSSVRHGVFTTEVSSDVALSILNLTPTDDEEDAAPSDDEEETTPSDDEEETVPFNPPRRWSSTSLSSGLNVQTSDAIINTFFTASDNDADGDDPIEQMMKRWNSIGAYTFFQVPNSTVTNVEHSNIRDYNNDGEMGIYLHSTWFSDVSSSALAVAQYSGFRRQVGSPTEWLELNHADIIVNNSDHTFSTDALSTVDHDLASVILHELGHFIGLPHQPSGILSVMGPSLSRYDSNRNPFQADIDALQGLYPLQREELRAQDEGASNPPSTQPGEGEYVIGIIELRADGQCLHYENNKLVEQHQADGSLDAKKSKPLYREQ